MRDNLIVEAFPISIEDQEVKQLGGKEISLVVMVWGGPSRGILTWEMESRMKESYSDLFAR